MSSIRLLRARGLRPKKSFGQNFLQDAAIAARIAELCTTPPGGTVLEIGAGLGALTRPLLARAACVIAVERDRDLVPILAEELAAFGDRLVLREADAVQLDWRAELDRGPTPHVVAGNLPYQITGRLIQRATAVAPHIARAVFMVQREVAERLCAAPGTEGYSALSVFAQAAFDVQRALRVPAGCFAPVPKVDSAVVTLTPSARAPETEAFRAVVKAAFGRRRKTLRNALATLGWSREELEARAVAAHIDLDARAETLSVEDFARLSTPSRDASL